MAKVGWSAGIDYVSGALSKPSKNGQHSCQKMLLGTHRTAATTSNNCNRLYLRPKIERSTPPTVNGSEGSGKWQKDHEGLPLEPRMRYVRRSPPAWLIVPLRKVNLPIRVPPLNTGGSAFFCPFSCIYRKKVLPLQSQRF